MAASVFDNISVSCFKDYETPGNPQPVKLITWLTSSQHRDAVERIRDISDKTKRDMLKAKLPGITPSGLFTYRSADKLIKHSGFLQFDIDFKGNSHITNYPALKAQICKIPNVAYCGLSVSGTGFWGLVPIAYPEKHLQQFRALQLAFGRLGITIDEKNGGNVSHFRGYSFDGEAYFNHRPAIFTACIEERTAAPRTAKRQHHHTFTRSADDAEQHVLKCLEQIALKRVDITDGYDVWFQIGCALANAFGEHGRSMFQDVSQFHPEYSYQKADKQFTHCLNWRSNATIGTFFYHCERNGITWKDAARIAARPPAAPSPATIAPEPEPPSNRPAGPAIGPGGYPAMWDEPTAPEPAAQVAPAGPELVTPAQDARSLTAQLVEVFDLEPMEPATIAPEPPRMDAAAASLIEFFSSATLPAGPTRLNVCSTVTDAAKFVEVSLATLRTGHPGRAPYEAAKHQLEKFRQVIQ